MSIVAAVRTAAILVCIALLAPGAASAQSADGFLLVAKPVIRDPNFSRTVILVAQTPDGAAVGVILNRPTTQSLAAILPGNPTLSKFTEPIYFGGPVERVGLFAAFRAAQPLDDALPVTGDLYLALDPATVERLMLEPPARLRFYTGYAGWAPGQVRSEIDRGDWWVLDVDADAVFRKDADQLWEELSRRAGAVTAEMSRSAPQRFAGAH